MSRAAKQQGIGMVEIMVALLVLAIGVLGYAGLQLGALNGAEQAHARANASALARDALERIMINPDADYTAASWSQDSMTPGNAPSERSKCIDSDCSSEEMRDWDREQLSWKAANVLPAGRVEVAPCATSGSALTCVVVSWDEQQPGDCVTGDGIRQDKGSKCVVMEVSR